MKKTIFATLLLLVAVFSAPAVQRMEHRSVWNTAMLSDWPYKPLTEANAAEEKQDCITMLDSLAADNFTTIYYHARAMSDAFYESSYEPWSSYVSGTRGVKPAFDPLKFLVEEGHKRGLEVYAWVNPFRYSGSTTNTWGQSPLDYIHTHPEWLFKNHYQYILNPGIPEVQDRVCDVCKEIVEKYDIDGVVFDDYFYPQGGTVETSEAPDYDLWKNSGTSLSFGDWRRDNINKFVKRVGEVIKAAKPWVRFGISPAGICCTASTSASKYDVKPCPGSDWQYGQIYSDPMNWIVNGYIDFLSPQVYWHDVFQSVTEWYYCVAEKFDRHVYPSQSFPAYPTIYTDFDNVVNEVNITRNASTHSAPGYVFFPWINLFNSTKLVNRKKVRLMATLKADAYTNKSWTPAMSWGEVGGLPMPKDVKFDGTTLRWTAVSNMRYLVYAYPKTLNKADFNHEEEYIQAIVYGNEYVPSTELAESCNFAVATLNRFGNESSALMAGEQLGNAPSVTIENYKSGEVSDAIFQLRWSGSAKRFRLEVAEDADFTKPVYNVLTSDLYLDSSKLPKTLVSGTRLYWRVRSMAANCNDTYSAVGSFVFTTLHFTYPTETTEWVKQADTFRWNAADGIEYTITISQNLDMSEPVVAVKVAGGEYTIPANTLISGAKYYARLTARKGSVEVESEPLLFTVESLGADVPEFTNPATDNATVYSDQSISVKPQAGASAVRVELCANTSFSPRQIGIITIDAFKASGRSMKEITKPALTDGTTYYVRARASYINETGATVNTEFSAVRPFVYSSQSGVESVETDAAVRIDGDCLVVSPETVGGSAEVVDASGRCLLSTTLQTERTSLALLEPGAYLVKVSSGNVVRTLKFVK